jgi:valyl-tRNA synthetase
MAQAIYDFTWNEYCDWYLELSKTVLFDDNASEEIKRGTRHTLVHVLETILRLAHPTMPYITEEIWQRIAPLAGINGESIMLQSYPEYKEADFDQSSIDEVEWIKNFIVGIRQIRSGMDIKPGKPLPVLLQNGSTQDKVLFETHESYLMKLAKLESITWLNAGDDAPESATSLVGEMKLLIPMAGLIDKDVELKRLDKEIEKLTKLSKQLEGKLSNPGFTDKAPEAVVQKERGKLAELETALKNLQQQKEKIEKL